MVRREQEGGQVVRWCGCQHVLYTSSKCKRFFNIQGFTGKFATGGGFRNIYIIIIIYNIEGGQK